VGFLHRPHAPTSKTSHKKIPPNPLDLCEIFLFAWKKFGYKREND